MAGKAFLMLEGIRGDSRTSPWTGWIPIDSVSFDPSARGGVRRPIVVGPSGTHSPHVSIAAANGKHLGRAAIVLVSDGRAFAEFTMTSVFIAGYQVSGGRTGLPYESITLDPGTFKATFHESTAMVNPSLLQRGWQVA